MSATGSKAGERPGADAGPGAGPAASGRARTRRAPKPASVLGVTAIGVFMAVVDATIVNVAFPDIAESFSATDIASLSWVLNAYNIVFAAFLVAAGKIADLIGRRRVFVAGLALFTIASVLCAAAPSADALTAFRVVQALGSAAMVPAALGLALEAYPGERRAHAIALLSAVAAIAAGLGPTLGGLLVAAGSWRLVFLVNVPAGIAAILLARRHLVESRAPGRRRMPDLLGAVVFAIAISALVLAIVKSSEWGWGSPRVLAALALSAALVVYFARRCTRHRSPIVDLDLLRNRTFSLASTLTGAAAAGSFGFTLASVLFLTGVWGYSVLEAGLALAPAPLVAAAIAGPTSRLAYRIGHRIVLVVGGTLWTLAVVWFVERVGATPDFVGEWLPGMILIGIGTGIASPNLTGMAIAAAPGQSFGTLSALNTVARQLGAALGVAGVVTIIGTPSAAEALAVFDDAWTLCAACLLTVALGSLALAPLGKHDEVARTPPLGDSVRAALEAPAPVPAAAAPAASTRPAPQPALAAAHPESPAEFLARAPLFAGLAPPLRETVAERARALRVPAGDWLFREGEAGDAMYVVRAGRLEVVGSDGAVIRELGRGDALGELALVTGAARSASLRAARDSDLIVLDREDFERLLAESPELSLALNRVLGAQLRESRGVVSANRPLPATVALVALDEGAPVREIGDALVAALADGRSATSLDGGGGQPEEGADPVALFGPMLDRAERDNEVTVLVAPSPFSPDAWSRFCLQQADRILAVSSGAPVPDGSDAHPELRGCDLVGWDVELGAGSLAGWAELLDPIESHVLARDRLAPGIERMARRLGGRSVGLVLSGGGARAFSHIGVLEELAAAGVTIDRVAGVSMGSFVGAMVALGMEPAEIDARCYEEFVRRKPVSDYTLPRHGLIRGRRLLEMCERTFGTAAIEELERSLFCASADLRAAELVVHRHGPLARWVLTSIAVPVLGPPNVEGRRILVDGSLIDNLPIATMAALGEGPIIAVDVKASFERPPAPGRADGAGTATEGDGGRRRSRPRTSDWGGPPPPPLGETLTRAFLLASSKTSAAARRHASLVIKPRNEGVGLLEFHQIDRAIEAGRAAAREALADAPAEIWS